MLLVPHANLQHFYKWVVYFLGLINPPGKITGAHYIITTMDYLMRCTKVALVVDYTGTTTAIFLFENIVTRFGCLIILMSDQGSHFINRIVRALTEELQVQHKKSTPYHLHMNGTVEAFNKILDHALTKVCNTN